MQRVDVRAMASVLANQVPEIKDRIACRAALAIAGYTDAEITEHLPGNGGRGAWCARTCRACSTWPDNTAPKPPTG